MSVSVQSIVTIDKEKVGATENREKSRQYIDKKYGKGIEHRWERN